MICFLISVVLIPSSWQKTGRKNNYRLLVPTCVWRGMLQLRITYPFQTGNHSRQWAAVRDIILPDARLLFLPQWNVSGAMAPIGNSYRLDMSWRTASLTTALPRYPVASKERWPPCRNADPQDREAGWCSQYLCCSTI
ncbi:hypothetical protein PAXRUDRAFT_316918 [Paxillus rubicundulus Ve08.2h10]|uniref:Uncharacterized protein n=1 Tax=Paxillus rubicundulus Ve08.2h10 TaxID=930991 RepID=A0A0D0DXD5_9AGAM|nr:hypothetical protein PAXRUDRAFT_316918 [Paxillus rubicundulus Ve08.2h10]